MADLALTCLTLGQLAALARERLTIAGIANAEQESRWLIQEALCVTSAALLAWPDRSLATFATPDALEKLENWLTRRENGEPLQYILGTASFYGRDFRVTPDVLIPRPDTELLVDAALSLLPPAASETGFYFLDFGTGSGCIAITLLLERPDSFAIMADASPAALRCASQNLERYGLQDRAQLLLTQTPDDLKLRLTRPCKFVISNPPYIPTGELAALQREVQREPRMALDGGPDGMDFYRALFEHAPDWLTPDGYLVLELGDATQAAALKSHTHEPFTFAGFGMSQKSFASEPEDTRCGIWHYHR